MDHAQRAFPKAFVVGFDAPPSSPVPMEPCTATPSDSCHSSASATSSRTARSLLTMLLKESQGSSAGSSILLHDSVEHSDDCDSQSDSSSWGDDADPEVPEDEDVADEGFEAAAPIPIITAEPMKLLASYWCSTRALTNKRLQSEASRR